MAQTLGEKLRVAREARGISLSEVAEQTRISPYYIEAIERDDYKPLPGGIFNKGFIKSFAKYVGVDENEALADYLHGIAGQSAAVDDEPRTYKPEVLTDSSSSRASIPTVLIALLILGGMTAAILFGLNYLYRGTTETVANANTSASTNANASVAVPTPTPAAGVPDLTTSKVEFKAVGEPVYLTASSDGTVTSRVVPAGGVSVFEPKERLRLSYSKSLTKAVTLTINGKSITLPAQPLTPKRSVIEFEINKTNFASIWSAGSISPQVLSGAPDASPAGPSEATANGAGQTPAAPPPAPRTSVSPRTATVPAANTSTGASTRPAPNTRPTVIIVPSANRPRRP